MRTYVLLSFLLLTTLSGVSRGEAPAEADPFVPYDIGGPAAMWTYDQLSPDERAVADLGLAEDQSAIQDVYATASLEMADIAETTAAATQLGFEENLSQIGVVE